MLLVTLVVGIVSSVSANDSTLRSEGQVAQHAKAAWEQGTIDLALDILNQGLQDHPHALTLHQLRGDMLATSRHTEAALQSYDTVLAQLPAALNVRWAKWSVLVRSGQVEEAVTELQRFAGIDFFSRHHLKHDPGKLETVSGAGLKPGVDLDNSSSLSDIMDGR